MLHFRKTRYASRMPPPLARIVSKEGARNAADPKSGKPVSARHMAELKLKRANAKSAERGGPDDLRGRTAACDPSRTFETSSIGGSHLRTAAC